MKGIVVKKTLKNKDNTSRIYILPSIFDVKAYWEAAYAEDENHTIYEIEIYAEDDLVIDIFLLINMQDSEFILDNDKGEIFEIWVNKHMREAITNDIAKFIAKDKVYDWDYVLDLDSLKVSWQRLLDERLLKCKKAINEYRIKK